MGVTVGVNFLSAVHKSSTGITIAFPDVCKTPVPGSGAMPIPYPNIAKTATKMQNAGKKTKAPGRKVKTHGSAVKHRMGDEPGVTGGMISHKNMAQVELTNLKSMLNEQGKAIINMRSDDPNEWQTAVQNFVVTASALYMTKQSLK